MLPNTKIIISKDGDSHQIFGQEKSDQCHKLSDMAREAGVKRLYMVSAPERMARLMIGQTVLPPTHAVDVRRVYPIKMLALRAHACQMLVSRQPMFWVGVVMRMYGREYFHRVI
jgi:hypothetical protein